MSDSENNETQVQGEAEAKPEGAASAGGEARARIVRRRRTKCHLECATLEATQDLRCTYLAAGIDRKQKARRNEQ